MPSNGPIPQRVRDALLFVAGLLGTGYETLVTDDPRTVLLMLFAAMMGLPAFLQANGWRKRRNGGDGE